MNLSHFISQTPEGHHRMQLLVNGMHCPSCVATIEHALRTHADVKTARLNLSTRRLTVVWQGAAERAEAWLHSITALGYQATPFDAARAETAEHAEQKFLLRCLAIAGFASGNLMMFSVPLWSGDNISMGEGTRTFFHWVQACIAIPAIAYCGLPFYRSAWQALRTLHTNMDVPISVALILATGMSLFETITRGTHSYFDSAVMLVFFLLIGRYLEARARGKARSAASDLLQMMSGFATVQQPDGGHTLLPLSELKEGMVLHIAAGEKIGADGVVLTGTTDIDSSLLTGESVPHTAQVGDRLFAGTLNLSAPITLRVAKAAEQSLLADIIRLMEVSEQHQARYVTLADRLAGWYTPVVHALALVTFLGWLLVGQLPWQDALLIAATVLIITCPCALGLAVPVVQVLASGKLMRRGVLLKSGDALERLSAITHAVFDKTGTLTLGVPRLLQAETYDAAVLARASALAAHSKHPLSRALCEASLAATPAREGVEEIAGAGLQAGSVRLGKRSFAAPDMPDMGDDAALELWFSEPGHAPVRFTFSDAVRPDAAATLSALQAAGIHTALLSGDRAHIAQQVGQQLGIAQVAGDKSPVAKTEAIAALKASGATVLMVGDGLNDAPSLAEANVSISPSSGMDITQNAADIVFQGNRLSPVLLTWRVARKAQALVKQNLWLAMLYNVLAIPLAVAGYVTPLIAALAMSGSSLVVIGNAMRINALREDV